MPRSSQTTHHGAIALADPDFDGEPVTTTVVNVDDEGEAIEGTEQVVEPTATDDDLTDGSSEPTAKGGSVRENGSDNVPIGDEGGNQREGENAEDGDDATVGEAEGNSGPRKLYVDEQGGGLATELVYEMDQRGATSESS